MLDTLQSILSVILCIGLTVKIIELGPKLRRDERTMTLTVALASFTVAALAGIPWLRQRVPFESIPGAASITMDTGVSVSLALLAAYLWRPLQRRRSSQAWWRSRMFASACAVSVLLAALMAATPRGQRTSPLANQYTGDWKIISIYVVGNLFFLYCSARSAVACVRISRIVHGHIATAVRVGAVGMTAYAVTCVNRLILVAAQFEGHGWYTSYSVLNFVFTEAAVLASVLGLHFTALWRVFSAVHRLYDDMRTFRRLGPAWKLLTSEHPQIVLSPERGLRGLWDRADISYRSYRRMIECQDALLLGSAQQPEPPGETAVGQLAQPQPAGQCAP